ncbi:MAG: lytic transglycosylase domain-containing protein [Stackebrandtia sp.]
MLRRPRTALAATALLMAAAAGAGIALQSGEPETVPAVPAYNADERPADEQAGRDKTRPEPSESEADKPGEKKDPNQAEPDSETVPSECGDYSGNRATACGMLADHGFGDDQMGCLDPLWDHESGWNESASNPSSGAYGIPQALPGDKMASHGDDWQTSADTQIAWGLDYISDRYGDPCGAWNFWQANNWY